MWCYDEKGQVLRLRRELLAELEIAGRYWQAPPHFTGGGDFALEASRADQPDRRAVSSTMPVYP